MIRPGAAQDVVAIRRLVEAWPSHFVPAALPLIEADFAKLSSLVWEEAGIVRGFLIWAAHAVEIEMLWMAVDPSHLRQCIGTRLVEAALADATTQRIVSLKTSDPSAQIPGTQFDGSAFMGTLSFFHRLGFRTVTSLESYWGPGSNAIVLLKNVDGGHPTQ